MPLIAAVVATHNRPQLLAGRSLASIAKQTRAPDLLVVVDDSDSDMQHSNRAAVAGFKAPDTKTLYLANRRTPGAAGAWNTALAHLQAAAPSAFVAILDDDDSWEPEYLHQCERAVSEHNLDMTASGIIYHESAALEGRLLDPPDRLVVKDLLIRNTHIQGSNIFAKLRTLLEAGGFDEALASTTDRDICIRLADLKTVRYRALAKYLVHHYAENDRPRLSAPGATAKCAGLGYFLRKHRGRMSEAEKSAFMQRSRRLFGCNPSEAAPEPPPRARPPDSCEVQGPLDLVVGAITSPDVAPVANLMDSLARKIGGRGDVTLKVVLLENGGRETAARDALREAIGQASKKGLDVTLKTLEQQAADAVAGVFDMAGEKVAGRKSIAVSRTMLQHYLFLEASSRAAAVVWILDDDVVLESLEYGPDGSMRAHDIDYVLGIKQLQETGASVVLCQETGDPPLPALSCIRTQLVDLYHNLLRMASLRPDDPYPDLRDQNRISRLSRHDYYYDLSGAETDHLELPFWYEASHRGAHTGQVFTEMVSRLPGILGGIQVFRPLTRPEPVDRTSAVAPSISRGPATLVFDVRALRDFPNAVLAVNHTNTRRSDMVWSLLNRFAGGRDIVRAPLPVRQVRDAAADPRLDFDCLLRDIRGHALYSALQDVFVNKAQLRRQQGREPHGGDLLHFTEHETRDMVGLYRKYVRERAHTFELSFIRIMGLLSSLRPFCRPDSASGPAPWWLRSPEYAAPAAELRKFVESLDAYTDARLDDFGRKVADIDAGAVRRFVRNLPGAVSRHRANTPLPADALHRSADAYVRSEFATGPLTCLGVGEEGVSLTDGHLVYKHFHHLNSRNGGCPDIFLRSLVGRLSGCQTLPTLLEVRRKEGHMVAVYPYEAGTMYDGGHLDGLLTLLRECRRVGIACRNIHPDNLLVTPSGLRLIDYGADIVPANASEFEQMRRRALLTYRFAFRSDLKQLMTRALYDAALAELAGLDQFGNALDPRGLDELFYQPMARMISLGQPRSVLEYGCGDGKLAEPLSRMGMAVAGYDPDPASVERCPRRSRATYGGTELRARLLADSVSFDAVVCSRVLCTIADNSEFEAVLQDLRRLVADSGAVLVAVCNPFYLTATSTELAEKHLPEGFQYESTFPYAKTLAINRNRRTEVHRSYAAYRQAFTRAGLAVREVRELDGTDTQAILPASEHLVFRLGPLGRSRVSLLIKTCVAEWRLIERLVRHKVRQLEGPLGFAEKVVVVDPHGGPFLRQYDDPDPDAHRAAMQRLLRDGVVDRVVYAPTDPAVIRSTYRKWFGIESVETHSTNGQQLFATLFGFDSCVGDYVLQMDGDILVARTDWSHNYLAEMEDVMRRDPKALFVSLGTCRAEAVPYAARGPNGDWRVEVRGCLYDRRRLESVLPVPNELENGRFTLAWHRAFDRLAGSYRSYRGGGHRTAFIHVPNDRKANTGELLDVIGAVERGHVPEAQLGKVDLAGSAGDWAGPHRSESFVFVICGRNVAPGRFKRCLQSLTSQQTVEWGAVVVDDASTNGFGDYAGVLLADHADRVTLIRNERQRGTLYNTWNAVTRVCIDPETVIVTLDADDALTGSGVLERVRAEYDDGADVTVGSMVRLDKEASYPVDFDNPRRWDSNVWQHLRTFKKRLFDAIAVEDLKIDGEWTELAADWAFMVPIVEMAANPRHISDQLCLYEPAAPKSEDGRQGRDRIIGRILSKTPYPKLK